MIERVIGGRYVYRRSLGKGGNGSVFLCFDTKLEKEWAIKEIRNNPPCMQSFYDVQTFFVFHAEKEILKKISCRYFPRIVDVVQELDCVYLVMDYVEGITLKEKMQLGRLNEKEVMGWAVEIAKALRYLHQMTPPILYMDCKPENIILTPEGEIRLVDLGSVYICHSSEEQRISGTKFFAPKEQQARDKTEQKPQVSSDIYGYGMTLYYLLAGKQKVYRRNGKLSMKDANPSVSYGFGAFLARCTEIDVKNRYQSMDEVLYQLTHIKELEQKEKGKHVLKRIGFMGLKILSAILILLSADFMSKQEPQGQWQTNMQITQQVACAIFMISMAVFLWTFRKGTCVGYEVKKDVFCGMGKRILLCMLVGFGVMQLPVLPVKAENVSEQTLNRRKMEAITEIETEIREPVEELKVTLYDSKGRKLLIKRDSVWKTSEDIFLSIPLKELEQTEGEFVLSYNSGINDITKQYKFRILPQ